MRISQVVFALALVGCAKQPEVAAEGVNAQLVHYPRRMDEPPPAPESRVVNNTDWSFTARRHHREDRILHGSDDCQQDECIGRSFNEDQFLEDIDDGPRTSVVAEPLTGPLELKMPDGIGAGGSGE